MATMHIGSIIRWISLHSGKEIIGEVVSIGEMISQHGDVVGLKTLVILSIGNGMIPKINSKGHYNLNPKCYLLANSLEEWELYGKPYRTIEVLNAVFYRFYHTKSLPLLL